MDRTKCSCYLWDMETTRYKVSFSHTSQTNTFDTIEEAFASVTEVIGDSFTESFEDEHCMEWYSGEMCVARIKTVETF